MHDRIANDTRDRIVNAAHSPLGRTVVAVLCSFVGFPALVGGLVVLVFGGSILFGLLSLSFAVMTLAIAFVLTMSVVIEAERASETDTDTHSNDPFESQRMDAPNEDPVARLRMRYARGELTDQEFERRLERLLETEPEADPLMEQTFGG